MKTNAWAFTRKVIAINHNRDVRKFFKLNIRGESPGATRGRKAMIDAMLINPKDSALQICNKQIHFRMVLAVDENTPVEAESWLTKHGTNIKQLVIVYKVVGNRHRGGYSVTIPHFNGSRAIKPPTYTKGSTPVVFNLKDRSKIVVNAESEKEGKRVINYLLRFVDPKFIANKEAFVLPSKTRVKKQKMQPTRADYFEKGKETKNPTWRIYL
ncbi:hypothetical protein [Nodularia sp. UHCC 0506]|uniref:hypothetical protein n=1 Tax=Nodularia sp. UHCC 0506 TaxID=3110243 RepID=UPI002B1F04DD|nr:hypothetical protein [Nodularia sp. UHCC 0506]MEA5516206.1 hypothetical protein [Nodularia sp. UHCC 0506]